MTGIEVDGLAKSFGSVQVLRGVTFAVRPGSITGLLGPNGAGKTTLMRAMVGLSRADAGRATFDGQGYISHEHPCEIVGCLLDVGAHHPGRSVRETMVLHARYAGLPPQRGLELLDTMGLGGVLQRRFGALSLGMRQRVGLALALVGRPRYLLLDEPMNGLDIETTAWVRSLLIAFTREQGGSVLLSSHLLHELETFADDVVILNQGQVAFHGPLTATSQQAACQAHSPTPREFADALARAGISYEADLDGRFRIQASGEEVGRLIQRERLLITELTPGSEHALESFYLSLTQGDFAAKGGRNAQ